MKKFMKKLAVTAIALAAAVTVAGTGLSAEAAAKKPTKITLKATSRTVDIKGKATVSVKSVKPAKASKSVTYKTSSKKIAPVSSQGVVTGKKAGKVKITVTSKVNKKVKASINITVKDLKAKSVKLNESSVTVKPGKTTTLKATVKGERGFYNQGVTWKSSDKTIAAVSSKGVVKGVNPGVATITATEKGGSRKAECKVTVLAEKVTGISFEQPELKLGAKDAVGEVQAVITPSDATEKGLIYTSSDEKIATVDENGKVTAVDYGEATITAATKDGSNLSASYKVTVTKPEAVSQRQVFVSPEWVKSVIDGDQPESSKYFLSLVDWYGDTAYKAGHVPKAVYMTSDAVEYVDWDPWPLGDGWDDYEGYGKNQLTNKEEIFNLRSPEQLTQFMQQFGITKDTTVILYGAKSEDSSVSRVAFACLYAGVENVKIINGGMPGWEKAGLPVETEVNVPEAGGENFYFGTEIPAHPEYVMSIEDVKKNLEENDNFRLVSIRRRTEFMGETSGYAYIDLAGEPAGAVWGRNTDGSYTKADGTIVDLCTLEVYLRESNSSLANELCFYCGTGWRATIPFLICYQNNVKNISLFDGGWWQWHQRYKVNPTEYPIQRITPEKAAERVLSK